MSEHAAANWPVQARIGSLQRTSLSGCNPPHWENGCWLGLDDMDADEQEKPQ